MSIKDEQATFIQETEWRQLVSEVTAGNAIIAIVPTLSRGEDRNQSKLAMSERFWSMAHLEWG